MNEFSLDGNQGYYQDEWNLISFEIGSSTPGVVDIDQFNNLAMPILFNVGQHKILIKGDNNLLPEEIQSMVGGNRLLPELIEKQVRILYGQGPHVYKQVKKNGKVFKDWTEQNDIDTWMDAWAVRGLTDSIQQHMLKVIRDFYYFEDYWVKWRFTKARRIGGDIPVLGLEHIDNRRCRLATQKDLNLSDDPEDRDFESIIVGNWRYGNERTFKIYKRLQISSPLKSSVAVSYHKNAPVGKIYGENKYYAGIKDWLTGMNRNPKYINSFLKNSLSAKIHLIIPVEWVESVQAKLTEYCEENLAREEAGQTLIKLNDIDIGTKYSISVRDKYIASEIRKLSKFLSGADNQGKLYATYGYQTSDGNPVQWKLEPIDLKYKEFITSLTDYDKRADEVTLGAKGLDASISSISKEGVISKSGSDLYYNYVIYLHNLPSTEMVITEAINMAIRINFPKLYASGYRIGFYNEIPSRQEEVSPSDRLQNTMNGVVEKVNQIETVVNSLNQN